MNSNNLHTPHKGFIQLLLLLALITSALTLAACSSNPAPPQDDKPTVSQEPVAPTPEAPAVDEPEGIPFTCSDAALFADVPVGTATTSFTIESKKGALRNCTFWVGLYGWDGALIEELTYDFAITPEDTSCAISVTSKTVHMYGAMSNAFRQGDLQITSIEFANGETWQSSILLESPQYSPLIPLEISGN